MRREMIAMDDAFDTYTRVAYLGFSGGAVIDTLVTPTASTPCQVDLEWSESSYVNDAHYFGTSSGAGYMHFTEYSNKYYWGRSGDEANGGSWSSGSHKLSFNTPSSYAVILDGEEIGSGTLSFSNYTMWIGRRGDAANLVADMKKFKITPHDSSDVANSRLFIPVLHNGEGKMLDLVNNVLYENSGTGSFTYGKVTGSINVPKNGYGQHVPSNI